VRHQLGVAFALTLALALKEQLLRLLLLVQLLRRGGGG
jgi:hypothetical protein